MPSADRANEVNKELITKLFCCLSFPFLTGFLQSDVVVYLTSSLVRFASCSTG